MKAAKVASAIIATLTFVGSIVIGRDWLVSGGGDWPAFVVWSLLCLSVGFGLSALLLDHALDKRIDQKLRGFELTDEDIRNIVDETEAR